MPANHLRIADSHDRLLTRAGAYSSPFPTIESSIGALMFPVEAVKQLALSPEAQSFWSEASTPENIAVLQNLPTWLVVGGKEHALSTQNVDKIAASYGSCPYTILEDAGHFIQEDCPETLVALLQMFMQSAPPASTQAVEIRHSSKDRAASERAAVKGNSRSCMGPIPAFVAGAVRPFASLLPF